MDNMWYKTHLCLSFSLSLSVFLFVKNQDFWLKRISIFHTSEHIPVGDLVCHSQTTPRRDMSL